jgi:hypothetical protein
LQAELQRLALFIIALDAPGFEQVSPGFLLSTSREAHGHIIRSIEPIGWPKLLILLIVLAKKRSTQ